MTEKVNEFLREISPMREAKFWHDFIARFLAPSLGDCAANSKQRLPPNGINANIDNNYAFQQHRAKPPPPPPKPKLFKPLQPARQSSSWAPSIVITPNIIDRSNNHRLTEHHHTSTTSVFDKMGAISDATEMQHSAPNGLDFSLMNCSNSEKSIATDMATMGTVDSNNNIKQEESEQTEQMSFQAKKDLFQSKSSSPNLCRTRSESGISPPPFERSNSLPGLSSSQPSQQLSLMQPHFASSSFYDPRSHPTIEEQVSQCREIAKQLVSEKSNAKSKGRQMFERRVEKSSKWVTENEDSFQNFSSVEEDYHERTISEGPPNLRLLLDPRHVEDINTVQGVNEQVMAAQEEQTRDTCRHIVQDLMSPGVNSNRGNALFAKRVQKSEEWIIDDVAEQVIDAARDKLFRNLKHNSSVCSSPIPSMSPFSRYSSSSPISGPVFTPVAQSLPPSRPSSAMGLMYSRFRDFNPRPKPFCRAY